MELTLNLILPDGSVRIVKGTALPRHDRPPIPVGIQLVLSPDDLSRLRAGVLRLRRAEKARREVGNVNLGFEQGVGFRAEPPVPDLALKAFALESRPFFLNDDPLFFPGLVKLRSFGAVPEVARNFRMHTKRWNTSQFDGTMGIQIGRVPLDIGNVIGSWFNSDLFHTAPQDPNQLSLEQLVKLLGGADEARALLGVFLISSLSIANEFFQDVFAINAEMREWWIATEAAETQGQA